MKCPACSATLPPDAVFCHKCGAKVPAQGLSSLSCDKLAKVLLEHPEKAAECAAEDWARLKGAHWSALLAANPQLADTCAWSKLDGRDWAKLLAARPQFADRCKCWDRMPVDGCYELLLAQPQFAGRFPLSKLCVSRLVTTKRGCHGSRASWQELLMRQPKVAEFMQEFPELTGDQWFEVLKAQPQFANLTDRWRTTLVGWHWVDLLKKRPRFAERCDWSTLSGGDWTNLLEAHPEFAGHCDWSKLDGRDWMNLLRAHPEFADRCDWSTLDGMEWSILLRERPQIADHCDWSKLDDGKRRELLEEQPSLESFLKSIEREARAVDPAVVEGILASMVPIPGKNYRMGKFLVTQAQYEAVTGENPSYFKGADNPVEKISWYDCQAFLETLNAQPAVQASGLVFRLPEEDEWENACRAGATGDYCKLADGTEITAKTLNKVAWFAGYGYHPVGQKKPNAFGLYDMHGNVFEWTATADGGNRVCRGGGWDTTAEGCESSYRVRYLPSLRFNSLGFRLCADRRAD